MQNNRLYNYVEEVKEKCNNAITIDSTVEQLKADIEAMCIECLQSEDESQLILDFPNLSE